VLLGSKPLHPDAALQRYVNRLGRWISLQSARPHLPWTFGVLDDPGFNAFAAPGGYVFVTKGLVDRVDEAELAGILAHEITHVTGKHHLKALARQGAFRARHAADRLATAQQRRRRRVAQMLALGRNLYSSGLDQGDEFEADRRASRSPRAPASIRTACRGAAAAARRGAGQPAVHADAATHPPAQQRLEQLEQSMGNRLDASPASRRSPSRSRSGSAERSGRVGARRA
jgi:predicted Zn-dependent protease